MPRTFQHDGKTYEVASDWKTRQKGSAKQKGKRFKATGGRIKGAKKTSTYKPSVGEINFKSAISKKAIIYEKKYDHWHVESDLVPNSLKWGFDLTEVNAQRWDSFLRQYGFKIVARADTKYGVNHPMVYENSDHIVIVAGQNDYRYDYVSENKTYPHSGTLNLGYMRFESPRDKRKELNNVLAYFRGKDALTGLNNDVVGAVATFVKEETPNSAGFI